MRRSIALPSVVLATLLAAGCSAATGQTWTFPPNPESAPPALAAATAAMVTPEPAPSADAAAVVGRVEVTAFDLGFKPSAITVDAPGRYAMTLKNTGAMPHDITFPDGTTTGYVDAGAAIGPSRWTCQRPERPSSAPSRATPRPACKAASPSRERRQRPVPAPIRMTTAGRCRPWTSPPIRTRRLRRPTTRRRRPSSRATPTTSIWSSQEKTMTVAPGFVQSVWTFNGTVPGPVIRVKVGDTVRVHLKNPATNKLPHSIDFHASQAALNDEMRRSTPARRSCTSSRPTTPASGCTTAARPRRSTTSPTACSGWSSSSRRTACPRSTRSSRSSRASGTSAPQGETRA